MLEQEQIDELQEQAEEFARDFANAHYEMGQAQNFMRGFCDIFGVDWKSGIQFEERIPKEGEAGGNRRIDGFLPGLLLIEMKSTDKDMEEARKQAMGYVQIIQKTRPDDTPRYVLVSDFQNLHLYDLHTSDTTPSTPIRLAEFRLHVRAFDFMHGYQRIVERRHDAVTRKAAEKLSALHDAIQRTGYGGKDLETLLVRILFCLFAEDTHLFGRPDLFTDLVRGTRQDGRDLFGTLDMLFATLDSTTAAAQRPVGLYPELATFPYVNGSLFKGRIAPCYFDADARRELIECAAEVDWAHISPAIFGSLFQSLMHFEDEKADSKIKKRSVLGAHYTSEHNILKVIGPLFLDDLAQELHQCKNTKTLRAFIHRLGQLQLFDPACGCGNFLVVAYRELRLLEDRAIKRIARLERQGGLDLPSCNVHQCYGIEIDPTAAQIATLALWLTDHQMNLRVHQDNGQPYVRLPLTARANIVCANALTTDWREVCPQAHAIMGNPPFVGSSNQNATQKKELGTLCANIPNAGVLDYVAGWYIKAMAYIRDTAIPVAFVSTNSITQGEQVGVLWQWMLAQGAKIRFAHRTFKWSNEGAGVAAVHWVIIGFGLQEVSRPKRKIYSYPDIAGEPESARADNINPYLVDAPTVLLDKRRKPLRVDAMEMVKGNQPTDGGNLLLTKEEADAIRTGDPIAAKYIRRFLGAEEFINNQERYCLWLKESTEHDRTNSPEIATRIKAVKIMRLESPKVPTQKLADVPYLFGEIRQGSKDYLLIPSVSSEKRDFIPIGYFPGDIIASNLVFMLPDASKMDFAILTSTMHNAWMRTVAGRLKSDYRYSNTIVYNNYPWPAAPDKKASKQAETQYQQARAAIETEAQAVLDARAKHPGKSLAWLYNPETMPENLKTAHQTLDAAVDKAYGYQGGKDDAARVAFLFGLYAKAVAAEKKAEKKAEKAKEVKK